MFTLHKEFAFLILFLNLNIFFFYKTIAEQKEFPMMVDEVMWRDRKAGQKCLKQLLEGTVELKRQ